MITNQGITVDRKYKFDWGKALTMRWGQKMSYQAIGKRLNVSKQAVQQAIKKIEELLPTEYADIPLNIETRLKKSLNISLLLDLADPQKRKDASLNNTGYVQGSIDKQIKLETGQATDNLGIQAKYEAQDNDKLLIEAIKAKLKRQGIDTTTKT